MADLRKEFGARLRFVREMREMSQAELAEKCGLEPSAVAHFEAGRRGPAIDNLKALAKGAMVSADYLLGLSKRIEA